MVLSVGRSRRPAGSDAAPEASSTLPSAVLCSGTGRPSQLPTPITYTLSTWAICSIMPSRSTPRLIVSPVSSPRRWRNGWASSASPASAQPRQAKLTNTSPGRNRPWSSRCTSPLRSSASRSREVVLLARPVVAASSVKVTEPGECTTSVRSLAARSTAWVPLGLVTVFPACALPPWASAAVVAALALDSSILQNHVLLCDPTDGFRNGQASWEAPSETEAGTQARQEACAGSVLQAVRRVSGVPGAEDRLARC